MKKIPMLITSLLILSSSLTAQVKFTASSEKVVQTGERFRLVFTINSQASGFEAPPIENFDVLSGPARSTSQSFQYINGKSTQSTTMSFTYILQAKKTGTFTIEPAKITAEGETYESNPVQIQVIKGSGTENSQNIEEQKQGIAPDDLFIRVFLNKTKAYKGEAVTATVKLYSRVDLVNIEDLEFPGYPGFFIKTIYTPDRINLERETHKGKIYNTAVLRRDLIFPQKSGKLNIGQAKIDLVYRQESGHMRNFFGRRVTRYENKRSSLTSNKAKLNVMPLPQNTPDNFSGIVAENISVSTEVSHIKLKTDESTKLTVKISGEGNLHLLDDINLLIPREIESFPDKKQNLRFATEGASGNVKFNYLLIPRSPGKFKIPPAAINYFDPQTQSYRTAKTNEIILEVEKSDDYNQVRAPGSNREIAREIADDIRYIKQKNVKLKANNKHFAGSYKFYGAYLIGLLIFALIVIWRRKQIKERANIKDYKNKRAATIAAKNLKKARKLLKQNNNNEFYKEITNTLWAYTADKFRLESSELTKDNVAAKLRETQLDQAIINALIDILNQAEYARYGGASDNVKPEELYRRAADIIKKTEQHKA